MKYQIISSNKISDANQEKIIKKFSKVEKLLHKSEDLECRIVIKFQNDECKAEITIPTPYLLLRSEVIASELDEAIDKALDKLIDKQIDKVKTRLNRSSQKTNLGKIFGQMDDSKEDDDEEIIVKNKVLHPTTMTLDDAVMEMESSDHDFYIFQDAEDQTLCVVYRRKAGGYGVIEIE